MGHGVYKSDALLCTKKKLTAWTINTQEVYFPSFLQGQLRILSWHDMISGRAEIRLRNVCLVTDYWVPKQSREVMMANRS